MSMDRQYFEIQRMIKRIRNPPALVAKYMNINAMALLLFIALAAQVENSARASPDGYASVPFVLLLFVFFFVSLILEVFIGAQIIVAFWWRKSCPDILAIGILKRHLRSEAKYRNTLIAFYRGQEASRSLTGGTLLVVLITGLWSLANAAFSGGVGLQPTGVLAPGVCFIMVAHYSISLVAMRKRKKWEGITDAEIHLLVEEKLGKYPEAQEAPTLEEMELLLERAEFDDSDAEQTADCVEAFLKSYRRRWAILWMIVFACAILLLL